MPDTSELSDLPGRRAKTGVGSQFLTTGSDEWTEAGERTLRPRGAMKDATEPTTCTPLLTRAYWAIWVVGLLIWTYLLVVPTWLLPPWLRATAASSVGGFRVQKLGHSGVYALLTAYPFLLPVGRRHWKVTTAVMAAHG